MSSISKTDYFNTNLQKHGVLKTDFDILRDRGFSEKRLGEILNGKSRLVLSSISDHHARLISLALLGLDVDKHDNFFGGYSKIASIRTIPMFD